LFVPNNVNYCSYYTTTKEKEEDRKSKKDKRDVIEDIKKKEIDINKLNENDLLLNTIEFNLYKDNDAIYPYQRPIAQRIWVRYDSRI